MPPFGPITRTDLIFYLRRAGCTDLRPGRKHQLMFRGGRRITIPNPHRGEISKNLLAKILRQAGISREEWEKL
jgi:predicted RNA binding protein YcfA (HicA-like mRNA interferase family)